MIRHDEKYLKLVHDHLPTNVYSEVKELPFFYFVIPEKWRLDERSVNVRLLEEVIGDRDLTLLDYMPFPKFSFVIDQDPCLHVLDVTKYSTAMFMVDYFCPVDYPSSIPPYAYDSKDIGRGLWAHYNTATKGGFSNEEEGVYGCVVAQHYRGNTIKNMELSLTKGPEIAHIFQSNMKDMELVLMTLLALFITSEDKRLVKVTEPKRKARHHQAKQYKTSRFAADHHYIYLDGPPAHVMSEEQRESTGRTVRGHARRAHWHKLTHPRYKNHPNFGGRVRVKATWVGPTEWADKGKIYALHDPEDL